MEILKEEKTLLNNKIQLLGNKNHNDVIVIGVFHGDEPQGKYLTEKYISQNIDTKLLFVPCLNPDGMKQNKRTNSNNVDLNRNFATKNWGKNLGDNATCDDNTTNYYGGKTPNSEIETQFISNIINTYKPQTILSLHAPYKVVNCDGPAKELAQKISEIIKYPVEESIGYPTPGSFGTYCGVERQIPVITLELDEVCPVDELYQPIEKIFKILENM